MAYDNDTVERLYLSAKEPSKMWKNHWRKLYAKPSRCPKCNEPNLAGVGDTFLSHCSVHPSYEIAEQRGLQAIEPGYEYLGPVSI